jgi:DNA-binding beta-propeller fold protein YncE
MAGRAGTILVVAALALATAWSTAGAAPTSAKQGQRVAKSAVIQLWGRRYTNGGGAAHAIAFAPDGSKAYVAGSSNGRMHVVAYDAETGAQLWDRVLSRSHGPPPGDGAAVAVSPDGARVYVTGGGRYNNLVHTGLDYITIAFAAADGRQLWVHRYDPDAHGDDVSTALVVTPDGSKVFVTGRTTTAAGDFDYATVAIDAATGKRLWARRFDGPAHGDDRATALAITPDGTKLYVTGASVGYRGDHDFATIAYAVGDGEQLWVRRFDGPIGGEDQPNAVAVNPDGTAVYVTGRFKNESNGTPSDNIGTVAYIASGGAEQWSNVYVGYAQDGSGEARAIAVSPDGQHIVVTGPSSLTGPGAVNLDYTTISFSTAGLVQWIDHYDGPAKLADVSNAVAISPDGAKVFVTGGSATGTSAGEDYATTAIDMATGSRLWVRRNNGQWSGDDEAAALAVSPDGSRVVVTGASGNVAGTGTDWSTLAYSTS